MAFIQQDLVLSLLRTAGGLIATKRLIRIERGTIGNGLMRCAVAGLKDHSRADLATLKEGHAFGGKFILPEVIGAFRQF